MKSTGETIERRPSSSFLVRVWLEARELEGAEPILRGYVRNLKSGEQEYFGQPEKLAELLMRQLRSGAVEIETEQFEELRTDTGSSRGL